MYSIVTWFGLIVLVNLMNFLKCCIGSSSVAPLNRLFSNICRNSCLKPNVTPSSNLSSKMVLVSPKVGRGKVVHVLNIKLIVDMIKMKV